MIRSHFCLIYLNFNFISQIKHTLDRSLYIYDISHAGKAPDSCMCCSSDTKDLGVLTCSACKDWYGICYCVYVSLLWWLFQSQ